jgi:hypothetical protein
VAQGLLVQAAVLLEAAVAGALLETVQMLLE